MTMERAIIISDTATSNILYLYDLRVSVLLFDKTKYKQPE